MLEKTKAHLKKHKTAYLVTAGTVAGVVLGAVVTAVTRNSNLGPTAKVSGIVNWKPFIDQTVTITFEEKSTPSKPVHLVGTDQYYRSLSEAARQTGHSLSDISKNANGKISDIKGDIFELVNVQ